MERKEDSLKTYGKGGKREFCYVFIYLWMDGEVERKRNLVAMGKVLSIISLSTSALNLEMISK